MRQYRVVPPDTPPVATYRIQLGPDFGFAAAERAVGPLAHLGISHLYLSPVAEAVNGSTHGYDVVDPATVRDALGGETALMSLGQAARRHGMWLLVDIVPNHVSTAEPHRNRWWWEVLRRGRVAAEAGFFDVDWEAADERVIVPCLGRPLPDAVEAGELGLEASGDAVRYFDRTFPLRPDGPTGSRAAGELLGALELQHHKLAFWRDPERNVRRFFTIDDLVAVRPEVPEVAEAVLAIAESLARGGVLGGVRVDHIDGLADPAAFLADLRHRVGEDKWVLVEKILVGDEGLPALGADGTTGYEWITIVDHLFTHPGGERPLDRLAAELGREHGRYGDAEEEGVREVLAGALRPDLERVARTAEKELGDPRGSWIRYTEALVELTVALHRYRTYLPGGSRSGEVPFADSPEDRERAVLAGAAGRAAAQLDAAGRQRLDQLVGAIGAGGELTTRWQQLTGPALAKGGEDRALYRWIRLSAHNEVGGDPGRWGCRLDEFHEHNARVARDCPLTLLASSTHDTKRSEDLRTRLLGLAEHGARWAEAVGRWTVELDGLGVGPARLGGTTVHLALQTAVGAWPIDSHRLGAYLVKAAREAERQTSWTDPDAATEAALGDLADVLTEGALGSEMASWAERLEPAARSASLAQLVLRLTSPGVPDIYQGGESWLHTLVDPDNRGLLDLGRLAAVAGAVPTRGQVWQAGEPKAAVMLRLLRLRRRYPACFGPSGGYEPLWATGRFADHVVAHRRHVAGEPGGVVTVAARYPDSRAGGWGAGTMDSTTLELPGGTWADVLLADSFEGERSVEVERGVDGGRPVELEGVVEIDRLLGDRPAAVLVAVSPRG